MIRERDLKPRDSLILHILVGYADPRTQPVLAYPSIKRIAEDAGYTVTQRTKRDRSGRQRTSYHCSTVSAALDRLREQGVIWTRQHGRGNTARHELLYRPLPSDGPEGDPPSDGTEGEGLPSYGLDLPSADAVPEEPREEPSLRRDNNEESDMPSAYSEGMASRLEEGNDNDAERERVRRLIAESPLARPAA